SEKSSNSPSAKQPTERGLRSLGAFSGPGVAAGGRPEGMSAQPNLSSFAGARERALARALGEPPPQRIARREQHESRAAARPAGESDGIGGANVRFTFWKLA